MTVPGPHPAFAPGQTSRRVATRTRAVRAPDADAPFMEAPPLILTEVDEVADLVPGRRVTPSSSARGAPRPTEQDPEEMTERFLQWRRRHRAARR